MKEPRVRISVNDILARYNQAFGLTFMKVAARFLNFPHYNDTDSAFAEMFFENNVTGDIYSFGVEALADGTPALPFQKQKPTSSRYLAPPPMISFNRGKHVVETPIDRSNHVVIENFGNKAYQFNMQGILIDVEERQYPGDLLKEVHRMFEAEGTYKAVGDIFDDLDIYEVFFKDGFKIDFVEGYVDTVKYSVQGVSVQAAEFLIE